MVMHLAIKSIGTLQRTEHRMSCSGLIHMKLNQTKRQLHLLVLLSSVIRCNLGS